MNSNLSPLTGFLLSMTCYVIALNSAERVIWAIFQNYVSLMGRVRPETYMWHDRLSNYLLQTNQKLFFAQIYDPCKVLSLLFQTLFPRFLRCGYFWSFSGFVRGICFAPDGNTLCSVRNDYPRFEILWKITVMEIYLSIVSSFIA